MFKQMDTSSDDRLEISEFKKAIPSMEKWGLKVVNP